MFLDKFNPYKTAEEAVDDSIEYHTEYYVIRDAYITSAWCKFFKFNFWEYAKLPPPMPNNVELIKDKIGWQNSCNADYEILDKEIELIKKDLRKRCIDSMQKVMDKGYIVIPLKTFDTKCSTIRVGGYETN